MDIEPVAPPEGLEFLEYFDLVVAQLEDPNAPSDYDCWECIQAVIREAAKDPRNQRIWDLFQENQKLKSIMKEEMQKAKEEMIKAKKLVAVAEAIRNQADKERTLAVKKAQREAKQEIDLERLRVLQALKASERTNTQLESALKSKNENPVEAPTLLESFSSQRQSTGYSNRSPEDVIFDEIAEENRSSSTFSTTPSIPSEVTLGHAQEEEDVSTYLSRSIYSHDDESEAEDDDTSVLLVSSTPQLGDQVYAKWKENGKSCGFFWGNIDYVTPGEEKPYRVLFSDNGDKYYYKWPSSEMYLEEELIWDEDTQQLVVADV